MLKLSNDLPVAALAACQQESRVRCSIDVDPNQNYNFGRSGLALQSANYVVHLGPVSGSCNGEGAGWCLRSMYF